MHAVVVEDLNTNAMTASAKGTVKEPGTNMKAKAADSTAPFRRRAFSLEIPASREYGIPAVRSGIKFGTYVPSM